MTPEEQSIEFIKYQIRVDATLLSFRSIICSIFQKVNDQPEHNYSQFEEVFKRFFDHYKVERLAALGDSHPQLAALVDDLNWDSYNPLDVHKLDDD
jgi:hypothetical protein